MTDTNMEENTNGDTIENWVGGCLDETNTVSLEDVLLDTIPRERSAGDEVSLYLICAEWNTATELKKQGCKKNFCPLLSELMRPHHRQDSSFRVGVLPVQSEEAMSLLCGDDNRKIADNSLPCPPQQLPVLMLSIRRRSMDKPHYKFLKTLSAEKIERMCRERQSKDITDATRQEIATELQSFGLSPVSPPRTFSEPIRIFIAGDRMSVGKTSVCLGILGSLVRMGYSPEQLAYIKPATQNESPQLVQRYCEKLGIECVPVGPVVYYRGFTRAFLAGETEKTEDLLANVSESVDKLARGKQVVIIDGVGFPAVGSICGTDNASVALASSYPADSSSTNRRPLGVLLVGGPGVGSAVDAFNLNATYFEMRQIPVLGAIYNKLSLEGFYSLENCKKQISLYFSQNDHQKRNGRKPFGFCPLFAKLQGNTVTADTFEYIRIFQDHVDISELLESAFQVQQNSTPLPTAAPIETTAQEPSAKRPKLSSRSREEIEKNAIQAGAAPSA